ncbi:type I-E CRISPR-associated protein Cas6/Cse3/CasE [Streptomyces sp. OE57]|uniref:type I-E CRISPR-associated protein Cas6/Cse3/CasE n=1 Tax=Streptomyces lacaronensis TaxID=3379885 RepID=UPI0039B748EE
MPAAPAPATTPSPCWAGEEHALSVEDRSQPAPASPSPPRRSRHPPPGLNTDGVSPSAPPAVTLIVDDIPRFRKRADGPRITIATFRGRPRVTDPDALLTGIGPAKGYGQGLLTLAPLPAETARP